MSPSQLRELWARTSRGSLLVDEQFGVCGLMPRSPAEARQSASDRADAGYDISESDWVLGEFVGDTDMLVGAGGGYAGLPEPPKMFKDDGQPLIPRAGDNPFPKGGTHISPDELAKSGDPELSNLGKFYQGMFGSDPNDPDNHA